MKVLNIMLGAGRGGIEHAFVDYNRCLLMKNHQPVAVVHPKAKIKEELQALQLQFIELPNWGGWDFFAKAKLKKIIVDAKPDVILAHANRPLEFLSEKWISVPVVPIVKNYSFKRALKYPNIITTTERLRSCALQAAPGRRVFILPNMVEVPELMPVCQSGKGLVLGTFGRFVKKKGFDVFIESIAVLKAKGFDVKAVIAGDGEEKSTLQSRVRTLGLDDTVVFLGWQKQQDFFKQIDIFCLPSRHEPFGIVLIEAFAAGVPVVSTKSEGPLEIAIDRKHLLFSEIDNVQEMADKLGELISDAAFRHRLALSAYEKVMSDYSLEAVAEKLDKILYRVVA